MHKCDSIKQAVLQACELPAAGLDQLLWHPRVSRANVGSLQCYVAARPTLDSCLSSCSRSRMSCVLADWAC